MKMLKKKEKKRPLKQWWRQKQQDVVTAFYKAWVTRKVKLHLSQLKEKNEYC